MEVFGDVTNQMQQ